MYYTHEYSKEIFNTFEECETDLEETIDIEEYIWRLDIEEIARRYFRRKSNEEFCNWFDNRICEIDEEIRNDLIFEYEEESEE